ncbi:MAG TPA: ribbon-helix-helix domain-containing protein [Terricaulis sp.]|nr:ribbon-helix-helix domain-containing protein [Terricaulis sp.]
MRYLQKRSLRISGHRTSVALEPEFWAALESIAKARAVSMPVLLAQIEAGKSSAEQSLASAARVAALRFSGGAG